MNAKLNAGDRTGSYSWTSFPRRRVHSKAAACKPPSSRLVAANPTSRPASSMFLGDGVRSILHASMVDEDQCPGAQYTVHRIHSRKIKHMWRLRHSRQWLSTRAPAIGIAVSTRGALAASRSCRPGPLSPTPEARASLLSPTQASELSTHGLYVCYPQRHSNED